MEDKINSELLIELAKLIKKYYPDFSESLADYLSSQDLIEHLVSILSKKDQEVENVSKNDTSISPVKQSHKGLRNTLIELKKTEPEKSELLVKFYDGLKDKTFLPDIQDIRKFVSEQKLKKVKLTSRRDAINPLIKSLLPLSLKELKNKLCLVMPITLQDDRSLEGWSELILNKPQRTKQDEGLSNK
ncbi:MAG: hypothetical protein F6J96_29150 [Symploca sp. SIO1C2]|nr:hypothetical protein [Symploca sp. SIO1C2]